MRLAKIDLTLAILGMALILPEAKALPLADLAADFSNVTNPTPNGWAYRQGTTLLPSVADWTAGGFGWTQPAWARAATGNTILPAWFESAGTPTAATGLDWITGDVIVHSTDGINGVGAGIANVTWTSAVNGLINISGDIWNGRNIGRANSYTLLLNGGVLSSGGISSGDGHTRLNPLLFSSNGLSVHTGDVIELDIAATTTAGDFVGVNLNITQVAGAATPEPATLGIAALGFLAAGFRQVLNRSRR